LVFHVFREWPAASGLTRQWIIAHRKTDSRRDLGVPAGLGEGPLSTRSGHPPVLLDDLVGAGDPRANRGEPAAGAPRPLSWLAGKGLLTGNAHIRGSKDRLNHIGPTRCPLAEPTVTDRDTVGLSLGLISHCTARAPTLMNAHDFAPMT
jgi:hypothetical protein